MAITGKIDPAKFEMILTALGQHDDSEIIDMEYRVAPSVPVEMSAKETASLQKKRRKSRTNRKMRDRPF